MSNHHIIYLVLLLLFNCENEIEEYESFNSEGAIKTDSFIFCSFIPEEIEYSYRIGKWTFNSSKGYKIAEGVYENTRQIIDTLGGCSYSYIDSIINQEKWVFWNEKGQKVKPTKKMINLISSNQMNSENPFD